MNLSMSNFKFHKLSLTLAIILIWKVLDDSVSIYADNCSQWTLWTACDSACERERHRMGSDCLTLVEAEKCASCVTTTSTVSPSCGDWAEWTSCDSECFRERHKEYCGYAIESEKCGNECVPSSQSQCGEWTEWECDDDTCEDVRTRRCNGQYERDNQVCEDCTPLKAASASSPDSGEGEPNVASAEEESSGNNFAAIAGGVSGAIIIFAGGASTYYYQKKGDSSDEIEINYNPEDEVKEDEPEDAFVYVERMEEPAQIEQEDWGNATLEY